ncbi:hypothetical protein [Qipengyuania gelatinilytica]|uniref:CDP-glycerol glycerophosphotransferase (TagB/SpsB family) n=1 Tax=Qipengyuania gelatinilytica TaxID=2867231 RepID=A0ABX9A216_9SPHN|nr:hypothetical protein [Qipengyuania gelatinilytica]QZD95327.1 hypothetical protein K3136_00945 [Qipengyuania gelatinilytica]
MQRALFLFNHDAAHQVAHLAPVAAAMAREHEDIETVVAFAGDAIRQRILVLIDPADAAKLTWTELDLPPVLGGAARVFDRILPASRLARLRVHEKLFEESDAVISTERTCLRVKERLGPSRAPLFVRVPHGTGDRSVTFHPDHRKFDLSLVAGPKMAAQLAANGVEPARIEVTGYSKFERIDLTARPRFFDNDRPTFVYNPHFDPYLSSWYEAGPQLLEWFASEEGQAYNLIFAPHVMLFRKTMHVSPEYKLAKRRPDVPESALAAPNVLVDVDGPRLFDMSYMLGADAYIGDASSQLYEFLVRPRAVFLLDPNGALADQGRETLPFLGTGPSVGSIEELAKELPDWAQTAARFKPAQEDLISQTFALSDTPASTRAAQAIATAIRSKGA